MFEMIKSAIMQITTSYSQYVGNGIYMVLFFISLIFINIWERRRSANDIRVRRSENNRLLFQYPLLTLVVIFNPLIAAGLIVLIDPEVYWRIFWILPVNICIAYSATVTVHIVPEKTRKMLVTGALLAIIIAGGQLIYSDKNYSQSANLYKLPSKTIQVCNFLKNDTNGETIKVAVPPELVTTIRQYDADIQMPYGRGGYDNTNIENFKAWQLYSFSQEDVLNLDVISQSLSFFGCNYLVLRLDQNISQENKDKYGFEFAANTDSFNIYRFNPVS